MENRLNKVTPNRPDVSWYLKWVSSFFVMAGLDMRSSMLGIPIDLLITCIGCFGWMVVGCLWNDRSLIVLNAIAGSVTFIGFLNAVFI